MQRSGIWGWVYHSSSPLLDSSRASFYHGYEDTLTLKLSHQKTSNQNTDLRFSFLLIHLNPLIQARAPLLVISAMVLPQHYRVTTIRTTGINHLITVDPCAEDIAVFVELLVSIAFLTIPDL